MVEQVYQLDTVFKALSDPTRRDILKRLRTETMSIGEIAKSYSFSFAGVAKHLEVLERARLVCKTRHGKEQRVAIDPGGLAAANDFLEAYRQV